MQRKEFYDTVRTRLGALSQGAVDGFELILDEAEKRKTSINDLAYILATAWWETARTMQPVREAFFISPDFNKAEAWRKKNLRYYPYYGRGYVQLTWDHNYKKAGKKLKQDFFNNPDLVMKPEHAIDIMFTGMNEGWFTGKALDDYIDNIDEPDDEDLREYMNARQVINGKDKKETIGKIAITFERALKDGKYDSAGAPAPLVGAALGAGPALATGAAGPTVPSSFEAHIASFGLRYFKPYEFLVKGSQHNNPDSPAYGLNADPPQDKWDNIKPTALILDNLRHQLGRPIVFSSVYRTREYNDAIGGAGQSAHVNFNAIDFSVRGSPVGPLEWAGLLRDMRSAGLFKGGIGVYSSFVHVDTRGSNADWTG